MFGEDLAETLKAAKAVNKSGIELKPDTSSGNYSKYGVAAQRPLNLLGSSPGAQTTGGQQCARNTRARMSSQVQHAAYPRRHP